MATTPVFVLPLAAAQPQSTDPPAGPATDSGLRALGTSTRGTITTFKRDTDPSRTMSPDEVSDTLAASSPPLASRAGSFGGSKIREMFDLAERHAEEELVRLEVGEPDFDTPEFVIDAAHRAAMDGDTHYTSTKGVLDLREAIAELSGSAHGHELDPATQVLVTTGGTEALYLAFLCAVDPGDEVIIPEPAWPNYEMQTRLIGATPTNVELPPAQDFELVPERVTGSITDDTAAVVLTTPCNPTGQVYDPAAIREVVDAAAAHDAYVIADIIYERINFSGQRQTVASCVNDRSNVIEVNSASKGYAMTGWRVGWLTGPPAVIDAAQALRQCTSLCPNSLSQRAAIAALEGPQEPFERMVDAYRDRRDYLVDRVGDIPHISSTNPEGTFYTMLDLTALEESSMDIAKELVTEYATVTTPGSAFGSTGEGHLRLSFANSLERLEFGLDNIERMVRDKTES